MKVFKFELEPDDGIAVPGMIVIENNPDSYVAKAFEKEENLEPKFIKNLIIALENELGEETSLRSDPIAMLLIRDPKKLVFGVVTTHSFMDLASRKESLKQIMKELHIYENAFVEVDLEHQNAADEKGTKPIPQVRFYRLNNIGEALDYLVENKGILWKDEKGYILQTHLWLDDFYPVCVPKNAEKVSSDNKGVTK